MARTPQDITNAELAVLQVLWEKGPLPIRRITEVLYPEGTTAQYGTVQKLLERLENKECVMRDRSTPIHSFSASMNRDDLVGQRLQAVAESLCGGSWTPLLTHLVQAEKLTDEDRKALRQLIDAMGPAGKNSARKGGIMNTLLGIALSNILMACILALIAFSAGRWLRRPALTHGFWVLVFLKLLTPPLFPVTVWTQTVEIADPTPKGRVVDVKGEEGDRSNREEAVPKKFAQNKFAQNKAETPSSNLLDPIKNEGAEIPGQPAQALADLPNLAPGLVEAITIPPAQTKTGQKSAWSWSSLLPWATGIWWSGTAFLLLLALRRLIQFHRLLRFGQPVSDEIRRLAKGIAKRMQVVCPQMIFVPGVISPMLWVWGGKPRLVLPVSLKARLTTEQWATLLAHELAHWRRRDHWVRWLELTALCLYWWCPLVWWAKNQLQESEEECCDAWVVSVLPNAAQAYALALVETVDFLSSAPPLLPPAASGIGHVHFLKRRLTMILRGSTPRALTITGFVVLLGIGAAILPFVPTFAQEEKRPDTKNADERKEGERKEGDRKEKERKKDGERKKEGEGKPVDRKKDLERPKEFDKPEVKEFMEKVRHFQHEMEEERRAFQEKMMERQRKFREIMENFAKENKLPPDFIPPGFRPGGDKERPRDPFAPGDKPNPFGEGRPKPPGGDGPRPGNPNPLERRLEELERKLDRLLDGLNKGPNPGRRFEGVPGQPGPGANPPQIRRPGQNPPPSKDEN